MINHKVTVLLMVLMVLFTGCFRQAYYLSPFNVNSNSYHAIPLKNDSIKAATFAGAGFTVGAANHQWTDQVYSFQGNLHRSHQFGKWQGYYGASVAVGNYRVNPYHSNDIVNFDSSLLNSMAGNKFFGGYGIDGGINYCISSAKSEWRIIGLETVYRRDFGEYLAFRKGVPDEAVDIISRQSSFFTAGLSTDIIAKTRKGDVGYKFAVGSSFKKIRAVRENEYRPYVIPTYFTQTLHVRIDRITGYGMLNFGTFATNFQFGMNYRL